MSQTSSRHSSKRSVSKQSNHAILRGSNKRLNKSNTSLSANSTSSYHQGVSLAILQYFKLLSRVSKTLPRHFPDGHKMLLLHGVINYFAYLELRFKSLSPKELILNKPLKRFSPSSFSAMFCFK